MIHQHSEEELRTLQRNVVDAVLKARPEPGGFPPIAAVSSSTFEGFIGRQLYWHVRGALDEGEEPPNEWIAHPDTIIVENVAIAVGVEALEAFSNTYEKSGELVGAAHMSWAASLIKDIDSSQFNDLVFRTADLIELANDEEAASFESAVLGLAFG